MKGVFVIENAQENDIAEITVLIEHVIKTCIDVTDRDANDLVAHSVYNMLLWKKNKHNAAHLVYRLDNRIVGVVLVKEFWNITSLFIDSDYQGRGIGKALITEALALCRVKSPKGLVRLSSSTHAQDFYRAIGFEQAGESKPLPGGCIPFQFVFNSID
ncbi:GNAT family N-acetyltransferase [Photobacterium alginatilyticum]|uniref:GNAT family N-acetyltransferase n=1 Tax=Photobacterium alginatilyticum TaxID=1775171 RepID=UPI0040676FE3